MATISEERDRGDWNEYRRLIVEQLQTLTTQQDHIVRTFDQIKLDVAELKSKQSTRDKIMWIMLACVIPILFASILERIKK